MNIFTDNNTYNQLIKCCSRSGDMEAAEKYFQISKESKFDYIYLEFGISTHTYCSLMLGYARKGNS